MGDLGREIAHASGNLAAENDEGEILEGLYCDCKGTLLDYDNKPDELVVAYLNAQSAAGRYVQIISSNAMDVFTHVFHSGLDQRIVRTLNDKKHFTDFILEELIDDAPELRARKHHKPDDADFRAHMRQYLENVPPGPPPPSA